MRSRLQFVPVPAAPSIAALRRFSGLMLLTGRSLCTDFIENQPWLRQAEPDLLVWCPNFPFLMRGPSAIQERIDLIPEREACLTLVGWQ